jgi:transmembrane sensor
VRLSLCIGANLFRFDAGLSTQQPAGKNDDLWTHGLLYANDMRLEDLAAELSRYRHGVLRCQAEVADLRVSGLYHLNDADATLALLERAYPTRVHSFTPYLTIIEPRPVRPMPVCRLCGGRP